jgi:hypothetical protein
MGTEHIEKKIDRSHDALFRRIALIAFHIGFVIRQSAGTYVIKSEPEPESGHSIRIESNRQPKQL